MTDSFVIYDLGSGAVSMMLRTDDPKVLLLNVPDGHSAVMSPTEDVNQVKSVNLSTNAAELVPEIL